MGLDIRIPLGCVFLTLGGILTAYGLATWHKEIYSLSMGIDINLWWGVAMLVFGGVTLGVAKRK